ncbi:MAG: phosphopantothenoylcysteine decarboxylase [Candidatus Omnitrophica bacterium]|nr:phosphopantothenoylcysteine decarboxylase [Candidatus Omnitrophota bacterium]
MTRLLRDIKVLITSGPTWVPIDAMRVITNKSTGLMGQTLAKQFSNAGAQVTLLEGPVLNSIEDIEFNVKLKKFQFFSELETLFKRSLRQKYDMVLHAAAVSDYELKKVPNKKIRSGQKSLDLKLEPTTKLINQVKKISPKTFLVGFKWEPKISFSTVKKVTASLFLKAKCDIVIANTTANNSYTGYIVDQKAKQTIQVKSRVTLAQELIQIAENRFNTQE